MKIDPNQRAQDVFAQLVEECRIGTVLRCVMKSRPSRTLYFPHKPGIDLTDLPVFYLGEAPDGVQAAEIADTWEAIGERRFRLPYPRCGFLHYIPAGHKGLQRGPIEYQMVVGRYYMMIAEETDNGFLMYSFMLHDKNMDHWTKQIWQVTICDGPCGFVEIAYEPDAIRGVSDAKFFGTFQTATELRLAHLLPMILKIMNTKSGKVSYATGSVVSEKINARRAKMSLPTVPPVRIIDLHAAVDPEPAIARNGSATKRSAVRPHYRRGTWRTLASGRVIPVRASAIHGGGANPPPWYEVRV